CSSLACRVPIRARPEWYEVKRNLRSPLGLPQWTRGLKTKARAPRPHPVPFAAFTAAGGGGECGEGE
ncbi:MAG: hypothetical protein NTY19_09405, partial [Planctomycetota bacterium]|nr:hypothetical protein [Planctomycetota bacterium]